MDREAFFRGFERGHGFISTVEGGFTDAAAVGLEVCVLVLPSV
jgi:hypothetical protein